ncbi:hypothetical protein [Yinghuangia sp. YIM S09857]|uniref:hypothetical protein n=1 Tax=Yinghuangia sp. YIM S09857 TaxID=3436929 RepID=UPI003F53BF72
MTDANARAGSPPPPSATPEALRAVLARVAPERLSAFDVEHVAAPASARSAISAMPLIRFAEQWAL